MLYKKARIKGQKDGRGGNRKPKGIVTTVRLVKSAVLPILITTPGKYLDFE